MTSLPNDDRSPEPGLKEDRRVSLLMFLPRALPETVPWFLEYHPSAHNIVSLPSLDKYCHTGKPKDQREADDTLPPDVYDDLVNRFNTTFKTTSLGYLCSYLPPRQWHRCIKPYLFAYRDQREADDILPPEMYDDLVNRFNTTFKTTSLGYLCSYQPRQ
ncbi:hypothetical protein PoB_004862500 [Plakobranchus ocellatus]|uniref:Uncharacterized protein n=1 Tax=Plakobranchus ocellatus TaxID=259542 RepID=A0AAV4BNI3_9GAST|nr:hypothetical protein PoB_004862500 [Plakobranchus ocellatus]